MSSARIATRVKKPKPRTAEVSASEHGRARAVIEQLQARNEELEQELAAERPNQAPTLDEAIAVITDALREMPKEDRRRQISRIISAVGLNIRDWVSTMSIGKD